MIRGGPLDPYAGSDAWQQAGNSASSPADPPAYPPERVVWLLGAGFSQPLGGPLFQNFFSDNVAAWVRAWTSVHKTGDKIQPEHLARFYDEGKKAGRWEDAEEFMALLEQADDPQEAVPKQFLRQVKPVDFPNDLAYSDLRKRVRFYAAIATSHFVDRIQGDLPEGWHPFERWIDSLQEHDAIISFNYDRVIEELANRASKQVRLTKLHGTVPARNTLLEKLAAWDYLPGISIPGPGKQTEALKSQEWQAAAATLRAAEHLVVVGYSFPPSDSLAASFILSNCSASRVTLILGPDPAGDRVKGMFERALGVRTSNPRLLSQQYLTEGTARLNNGAFRHPWPPRP